MNESLPIPTTLPELAAFYPRADLVWAASQIFALAIPLVFLFSGLSLRLRTACERAARGSRYWTVVLFACAYLTIAAVVALPVGYLAEIVFIRAWNGPTPTAAQWLASQGIGLAREFILAAALVWIPYCLMVRSARMWWLASVVALAPLIAVALVVYQLLLTPLWVHYHPLQDAALAARFEALEERCGVSHIPVVVGGADSTALGMGPFRRIVMADDPQLDADEQVASFAHELKHYLLDGWKGIGTVTALLAAGLCLVDILGRAAIRAFAPRFGFSSLSDPASLPLLVLILSASWLLLGLPVYNGIQRHAELEADRFSLELTHLNRADARFQIHIATYSLNDYYPFYRIWRATHPSQSERVRLANSYRPWESGGRLVYDSVCRMP